MSSPITHTNKQRERERERERAYASITTFIKRLESWNLKTISYTFMPLHHIFWSLYGQWVSLKEVCGKEKEKKQWIKPTTTTRPPSSTTHFLMTQRRTRIRIRIIIIMKTVKKQNGLLWFRFGSCQITWRTTSSYTITTEPIGLSRKLSSAFFVGIMKLSMFGRMSKVFIFGLFIFFLKKT